MWLLIALPSTANSFSSHWIRGTARQNSVKNKIDLANVHFMNKNAALKFHGLTHTKKLAKSMLEVALQLDLGFSVLVL